MGIWKSETRMVDESTMNFQIKVGVGMNMILKALKPTTMIRGVIVKGVNGILKVIVSTTKIQLVKLKTTEFKP